MLEVEIGRKLRNEIKVIAEKLEVPCFLPWKIPDSPWQERNSNPCDRIMGLDGKGFFIEMKRLIRVSVMEPAFALTKVMEMLQGDQLKDLRRWASTGNRSFVVLGQVEESKTSKMQHLKYMYVVEVLPEGEVLRDIIVWAALETRKRMLLKTFFGRGSDGTGT